MAKVLRIAINSPLHQCFDYLPADETDITDYHPGQRVLVSFGRRQVVGCVASICDQAKVPVRQLKKVIRLIDKQSIFPATLFRLYERVSAYYHHSLGEVILGTLPKWIREGREIELPQKKTVHLTDNGMVVLQSGIKRAPKQLALLQTLANHDNQMELEDLLAEGFTSAMIKNLVKKQYLLIHQQAIFPARATAQASGLSLSSYQQQAIDEITKTTAFKTFLLQGVTGSGKTEVYLQSIARLAADQQALVLVPEIALTPQTVERFTNRFQASIVVIHSGITAKERMYAWAKARAGIAKIVIGTRSAIFAPLKKPGIIIVDEEHDPSFKQQTGFRYSARDVAVLRGSIENIPVVLGSATPSLESIYNAKCQRYELLSLPNRVGKASLPNIQILNLCNKKLVAGISEALFQRIDSHLANQNQVLLFLNRRGYAPILICHHCGWSVPCHRCDARLTLHRNPHRLFCHHCGHQQSPPKICPSCRQSELSSLGLGTEKIEAVLQTRYPDKNILRIDRDTVSTRQKMYAALQQAEQNQADILIGTQMLAKGHHFPNLTLAAIIDVDSGLFSSDFRATERMAQLILQVAGRAGREAQIGEVVLQTHQPSHPLLISLVNKGYAEFASQLLNERELAKLPPYGYLILLRSESVNKMMALKFLEEVKRLAAKHLLPGVNMLGPVPAIMERKAGRYRAQLLLQSTERSELHDFVNPLLNAIDKSELKSRIRWNLDVDPQSLM